MYERARPGYPEEAARWLLGDAPRRVVDLGAGTGKLTRLLAALGHDVVAVEPLEQMRAQLLANVPGVECVEGSAERIPLADASADAVVAAQAYHWFDAPVALVEIARVLRPQGTLGLIWNTRDLGTPWVARLSGLVGESPGEIEVPPELEASGLYANAEREVVRHVQPLDRELLLALVSSWSQVATMSPEERAACLEQVGRIYDENAGPAGLGFPYVTYAFRAIRL